MAISTLKLYALVSSTFVFRPYLLLVSLGTGPKMAKKIKERRIIVKLVSTALTGFFYTTTRIRDAPKIGLMKYDPRVRRHVLFVEGGKLR